MNVSSHLKVIRKGRGLVQHYNTYILMEAPCIKTPKAVISLKPAAAFLVP